MKDPKFDWFVGFLDQMFGISAKKADLRRQEESLAALRKEYEDGIQELLQAKEALQKERKEWEESEKNSLIQKAKYYKNEAKSQVWIANDAISDNKRLLDKNIKLTELLQEIKKTIVGAPIFKERDGSFYPRTFETKVRPFEEP